MPKMGEPRALSAAELAQRLGGLVEGDEHRLVRGVGTLEQAGPDGLSWVGSPEMLPRAAASNAGVVLIPEGCALPSDRTVIRVRDPDTAFCEALELLAPPPDRVPSGVHPTAVVMPNAMVSEAHIGAHVYVGPDAIVGRGTQIFPGTYVGARARIGIDGVLWPNVVVRERVTIGNRVVIHANATIGADGFGYLQRNGRNRKIPQIGSVVIEDDVEIGANTTIDRARSGVTRIGRGTKIDNLVQIGHNCDIGEDCVIISQSGVSGSCTLGRHVVVGGQVGVADHLCIGDGARIVGQSGVTVDVPAGRVVRGTPAVEFRRHMRELATLRKLPVRNRLLRDLTRRLERLEQQLLDMASAGKAP